MEKDLIKVISSDNPFMISRLGSLEARFLYNFLVNEKYTRKLNFISHVSPYFKYNYRLLFSMQNNAGFFPLNNSNINLFCKRYINDLKNVDILGCWNGYESKISSLLSLKYIPVPLRSIEPFYSKNSWVAALNNKKILVINPFTKSIINQHKKFDKIFDLKFTDISSYSFKLNVFKPVISNAGNHKTCGYDSWSEALLDMQNQIKDIDFDIAIIGAGSYGLPLASFVKSLGKGSIHLGGSTQILFGIKGKRWDNHEFISKLYNENWVRPDITEIPNNHIKIEDGCYW